MSNLINEYIAATIDEMLHQTFQFEMLKPQNPNIAPVEHFITFIDIIYI